MTVTEQTGPPTGGGREDTPLLDLLSGFIVELRQAGLPVSLTENLDAMEAVTHIPIADRDAFKYALGSTLVKNHSHWRSFEVVFEVYFSMRGDEYRLDEVAEGKDLKVSPDRRARVLLRAAEGPCPASPRSSWPRCS